MDEQNETIEQRQAWVIKPKHFRHKVTGEIVTSFNLMEINQYEEVE